MCRDFDTQCGSPVAELTVTAWCGNGGSLYGKDRFLRTRGKVTTGAASREWFALQVRTRWEGSTAILLSGKGYEVFLPTYKIKKRWTGRLKEVAAPLFPGYVFCQFDVQKRLPILVTPGVISVVSRGRIPIPVDDIEMAAIQKIVSLGFRAEPYPYLELGQRVRIESDVLKGIEGILINFKGNHRIVVSVSLLRRSVALEIDRSCVKPVLHRQSGALEQSGTRSLIQDSAA
jgi:transcription antitermination factor NusG